MKLSWRNIIGNRISGWAVWVYMALCNRTIRWTVQDESQALKIWQSSPGVILASWHSTIMLMPSAWNRIIRRWPKQKKSMAVIVSWSKDGEIIDKAIRYMDLCSIRGSSTHKDKKRDKGGAKALIKAVRFLKDGNGVCITPDGPRGPAKIVPPGAIIIAQRAKAPILPYIVVSSPRTRLDTWDKLCVPYPFTRGVIVFGEAVIPSPGDDCDMLRLRLQKSLNTAMARAEGILGLPADG